MTTPGERFYVCKVADLDDGRTMAETPEGDQVLIIRDQGTLYAIDALCPHQYAPLVGGEIEGGVLTCPLHGWRFSLATGIDPDNEYVCVETWLCGEEHGRIWIAEREGHPNE
jgi:toluene monooxygenase system ferredoxin subunit